jgi:hypothetical protein
VDHHGWRFFCFFYLRVEEMAEKGEVYFMHRGGCRGGVRCVFSRVVRVE